MGFFGVSTAACKAKNGVFYGGKKTLYIATETPTLIGKVGEVKALVREDRENISNTLKEGIKLLRNLTENDDKRVKEVVNYLVKREKQAQDLIDLASNQSILKTIIDSISKFRTIKDLLGSLTDVKKNYLDKVNVIVEERGAKILKDSSKIILQPNDVISFDMLKGVQILKSEHDVIKKDYKIQVDDYLRNKKIVDNGLTHGINVNLNYTNGIDKIYSIDFAKTTYNLKNVSQDKDKVSLNVALDLTNYHVKKYRFVV